MTVPAYPHWPASSKVVGFETLTRFTDLANNSDKYRRFILVYDEDNFRLKALITQTGRWTADTARGDWSGGTYVYKSECTTRTAQQATPIDWLRKEVRQKQAAYSVVSNHEDRKMTDSGVEMAIRRANEKLRGVPGNEPLPSGGVQVDLAGAVNAARRPATPVQPRPALTAPLAEQVIWLTQRAATPGTDQLELLTIYSEINETARRQKALVDGALSELADTLRLISLK